MVRPMSFKAEVIADSSGEWTANALRFENREEAEVYVSDLAVRWTSVRDTRVVESPDPANVAVCWDCGGRTHYEGVRPTQCSKCMEAI